MNQKMANSIAFKSKCPTARIKCSRRLCDTLLQMHGSRPLSYPLNTPHLLYLWSHKCKSSYLLDILEHHNALCVVAGGHLSPRMLSLSQDLANPYPRLIGLRMETSSARLSNVFGQNKKARVWYIAARIHCRMKSNTLW